MMVFKTRTWLLAVVVALVATGALGLTTLKNLWRSAQSELQSRANSMVSEKVEVQAALEKAKDQIPRHLSKTRAALKQCRAESAKQKQLLAADQAAKKLVEKDLAMLAACLHNGQSATLRGRVLSPADVQREAARLMGVRKRRDVSISSRKVALERLQEQCSKIAQRLEQAELAASRFSERAKSASEKLALLAMAKRAEKLSNSLGTDTGLGVPDDSLKAINDRLDLKLDEMAEREKLSRMVTDDSYQAERQEVNVLEELKALYPQTDDTTAPKETEK